MLARSRGAVACPALAVALLFAGAAAAQGSNGFDTGYLVPAVGQECDGVPQCASQPTETITLAPGERREVAFRCAADHPFLWNWDADAHHHLSVIVRALNFAGLTVVATNRADAPGELRLHLACSKQPWARTGVMMGTSFLPKPPDGGAVREEAPPAPGPPGDAAAAEQAEAAEPAATAASICSGIPECQEQRQTPIKLKAWQTKGWAFYCTGDHPFYVKYRKDGSCCTATENPFAEDRPSKCDVTLTNWKFTSHEVTIVLACSKIDPNGPPCKTTSGVVRDPKCPINGKVRNTCSGGVVPVCIQTWEERCSDGRVFECTADQGVIGCYQCSS